MDKVILVAQPTVMVMKKVKTGCQQLMLERINKDRDQEESENKLRERQLDGMPFGTIN